MAVRLPSWGRRQSKYGNQRIKAAGVSFDSQSEQRRWEELKLLEKAGEIRNLVLHPRFSLDIGCHHICDYVADYSYEYQKLALIGPRSTLGTEWIKAVEDRKAGTITQTDVFKLKRKLMKALHGIDILITGEST